ncbi:MAG: hypothetical protein V2I33_17455, partial [Kangiellaceae bacterium]|nr:hypothetical protein [Kangiellaceae bacterium]
ITKAFLQLSLAEQDRDVHRFLWKQGNCIRVMRFLRVTFGVNCSPFLLNATICHHLDGYAGDDRAVQELRSNLYVDDLLTGADTQEEAEELFVHARRIMAEAGMSLSKWTTSDSQLAQFMHEQGADVIGAPQSKVLGVKWLPREDAFSFEGFSLKSDDLVVTKRILLSCIARVFDPVGFIAPFIVSAKLLFQDLWRAGVGWDEELSMGMQEAVSEWLVGMQEVKAVRIKRGYFADGWGSCTPEVHVFGDASEKAYGCCAYLRRFDACSGRYISTLLMSRARVAPLKRVTLPRLELLACLLAARMARHVCDVFKQQMNCYFWSDSMIALGWIRGDPLRWKQFVANRVREIQELTEPSRWAHTPGVDNPADLLTRGCSAGRLVNSELWWEGPRWLQTRLPCADPIPPSETDIELCVDEARASDVALVTHHAPEIFPVERWGTFSKAVRVVAWVMKFVRNVRAPVVKRDLSGDLSREEVAAAKVILLKEEQKRCFSAEYEMLLRGQGLHKGSPLFKLNPTKDTDGLLRMKGRLQRSDLSYDEKHPIILPRSHCSLLIVHAEHHLLKHAGVETMIGVLRSRYWIIGLRRLAKRVKGECTACLRHDSLPCNQETAPLPADRVKQSPPFAVVGIDHAGPLLCVDYPGKKFYFLLFTCAVTRAVHLELVESMTTCDTLMAMRRFASRRGMPGVIHSDNAKGFVRASKELLSMYGTEGPEWKIIAPRAPWWGGWWERMVRTVKSALRKSIGVRCLKKTELETVLHEIEACVNSRPLTFVGDAVDASSPLTPSHFLIGRTAGFPADVLDDVEVDAEQLENREKLRRARMKMFWNKWRDSYLRSLPAVVAKSRERGVLEIGSVVLIRDDGQRKLQWPMGVVEELLPGKDGVVRAVKLRTSSGVVVRPVQRLHHLECCYRAEPSATPGNNHSVTRLGRQIKTPERLNL